MNEKDVTHNKPNKSASDPNNYRPISLLNTTYKIYAAIIQKRFASKLAKYNNDTQFGFRQHAALRTHFTSPEEYKTSQKLQEIT